MDYLVSWEINIEADSPKQAAQEAKEILQTQIGPVLDVVDDQGNKTRVDFLEFVGDSIKSGRAFGAASASRSQDSKSDDCNGRRGSMPFRSATASSN